MKFVHKMSEEKLEEKNILNFDCERLLHNSVVDFKKNHCPTTFSSCLLKTGLEAPLSPLMATPTSASIENLQSGNVGI